MTQRAITPTLLSSPHHDGSALYVSELAPRLGDVVSVWLCVPADMQVADVHVRTVVDGEPEFVPATVDAGRSDGIDTWWQARLRCHNPVTGYRWILTGGPTGYAWLNGAGLHLRDVPDAGDFRLVAHDHPPPDWSLDSVVYQVFPDRFAKSSRSVLAGSGRGRVPDWAVPARWTDPVYGVRGQDQGKQLYGGDLDGITDHLDHLERLGTDVLYLTPFFPARSNHRYDASTFGQVDPVLGGDDALRRLTAEAHRRGMRVLGDITTNHTGDSHEWFVAARGSESSPERDFYFWTTREDYVGWLGVTSLPKLNWDSAELRRRFLDDPDGAVRRWLGPAGDLDGWRVDVANMTGRHGRRDIYHQVAAWTRDALAEARPDALLVAEHGHDYSADLPGDGWHGVMNYVGFTKPLWTWLCDPDDPPEFLGLPTAVPHLDGGRVMETMREFTSHIPWTALTHSFNLIGSHDTTRARTLVDHDPRLSEVAAGLLLTMPSIPMVTYGDEIGMEGAYGEDGRRPMPWDERRWDRRLFAAYRSLVEARRGSVALRRGGLRWVYAGRDVMVYLRESAEETALVHIARASHDPVVLDAGRLPGIAKGRTVFGRSPEISRDSVTLAALEPRVGVHVWTPARSRRGPRPGGERRR